VVVGPEVTIKGNCTIFQDVVLGARTPAQTDGPTLAPHTFIYPGARILGKVYIGARSQVGPNCVIYRDIPEGSTVLPPEPMVLEGLSFSCRFEYSEEEDPSRLVAP
jgi:serine O-acetyltransferase